MDSEKIVDYDGEDWLWRPDFGSKFVEAEKEEEDFLLKMCNKVVVLCKGPLFLAKILWKLQNFAGHFNFERLEKKLGLLPTFSVVGLSVCINLSISIQQKIVVFSTVDLHEILAFQDKLKRINTASILPWKK